VVSAKIVAVGVICIDCKGRMAMAPVTPYAANMCWLHVSALDTSM